MPDITMCATKTCKMRKKCYRYMAIQSEYYQSFSFFTPKNDTECENFYPIAEGRKVVDENERE